MLLGVAFIDLCNLNIIAQHFATVYPPDSKDSDNFIAMGLVESHVLRNDIREFPNNRPTWNRLSEIYASQ